MRSVDTRNWPTPLVCEVATRRNPVVISIFALIRKPGGRLQLTPLYDVMSAQPNVDEGEIKWNKMKLAMAIGDNRHYVINTIVPRHFLQTVKKMQRALGRGAGNFR